MDRIEKVMSRYENGKKTMTCTEVTVRQDVVVYEELITDCQVHYEVEIKTAGKHHPYTKVFMDKDAANRYALYIIRKEDFKKVG